METYCVGVLGSGALFDGRCLKDLGDQRDQPNFHAMDLSRCDE